MEVRAAEQIASEQEVVIASLRHQLEGRRHHLRLLQRCALPPVGRLGGGGVGALGRAQARRAPA